MRNIGRCLVALGLLIPCMAQLAGEEREGVALLERLVSQELEVRAQIARERQEWTEQEARIKDEMAILRAEEAALERRLADSADQGAPLDQECAGLAARKAVMEAARAQTLLAVERAEEALRAWAVLIPPALDVAARDSFRELPAGPAAAAKLSLSRRLQLVVALHGQIDALQHKVHVCKEVLPTDAAGGAREVDVVYIGLARGFAVSPDDAWSAIGTPAAGGWKWQAAIAIAPEVRRAVRMAAGEHAVSFVNLPLQAVDAPVPSPGGEKK